MILVKALFGSNLSRANLSSIEYVGRFDMVATFRKRSRYMLLKTRSNVLSLLGADQFPSPPFTVQVLEVLLTAG